MAARIRLARTAAVGATGAALLLGEAAERYDDAHRVVYATQKLRKRLRDARAATDSNASDSRADPSANQEQAPLPPASPASTAWIANDAPRFPYLLDISPGDNMGKVIDTVLDGSTAIGSSSESTSAMLRDLLTPTSAGEQAISAVAQRWKLLKASLHADVPAAFAPRASALTQSLADVLAALQTIESYESERAPPVTSASDTIPAAQDATVSHRLVFVLRDFDAFNHDDAAQWLEWVHRVTTAGLAHVVLPTRAGITPRHLETLETRHGAANGAFVAILLRVAKGVGDSTSALDKLREFETVYELGLRVHEPTLDDADHAQMLQASDAAIIIETAGNWWSDLVVICERLAARGLSAVTDASEREALVRAVCDEVLDEAMASVLQQIRLDGSLDLMRVASAAKTSSTGSRIDNDGDSDSVADEETALRALEAWKCFEVVTGLATKSGVMASPQQFVLRDTSKPLLCAHPVEALLPFGHTKAGETKFFELIDERLLFLRPKAPVEIGVVPCTASELVGPCWIETRPIVARACTKLWRNDTYFRAIQDLERIATTTTLREEIRLYAEEIDERRQLLTEQRAEFVLVQFQMTKAERAARIAELSLLELEIQSKDVYLERLRGLLLS